MTPTPTTQIEELAKKAIEARKLYDDSDRSLNDQFFEQRRTLENFLGAVTPEAWLTLSARNRELEGRDALRDITAFELEERMAKYEEALKPFAHESLKYVAWKKPTSNDCYPFMGAGFTIGDLRRAARALSPGQSDKAEKA